MQNTKSARPVRPDEGDVLGAEHKVAAHFGEIDWEREQPDALLGRQQGTMWHGGLDLSVGDRDVDL
jgi:hypothetical protein